MEKPSKNEQWLLNGDCDVCRRKTYCKKDCTVRARAKQSFVKNAIRDAIDEATGGAFSDILSKSRYDF